MKKRTLLTMVAAAIMTLAPLHSQASSANGTETVTYLVLTQTDGTVSKFSLRLCLAMQATVSWLLAMAIN